MHFAIKRSNSVSSSFHFLTFTIALSSLMTRRFFGFNLPFLATSTKASSSLAIFKILKKTTYVDKTRYLWIKAAEQAWCACVRHLFLVRLSKRPTKHGNKSYVSSCLIECLMAVRFYQRLSKTI